MIMRICPHCKRKVYSANTFEKEWRCPYWDCGMVFTAKDRSVNE